VGEQPRTQRIERDQATLADFKAFERAGPERGVDRRPAKFNQLLDLQGLFRCISQVQNYRIFRVDGKPAISTFTFDVLWRKTLFNQS
jgi:hypothetical protein